MTQLYTIKQINVRDYAPKAEKPVTRQPQQRSGFPMISPPLGWPSRKEFEQFVQKSGRNIPRPCEIGMHCGRRKVKDGEFIPGCKCIPPKHKSCEMVVHFQPLAKAPQSNEE
jgi:hypothetical protein